MRVAGLIGYEPRPFPPSSPDFTAAARVRCREQQHRLVWSLRFRRCGPKRPRHVTRPRPQSGISLEPLIIILVKVTNENSPRL